MDVAQVMTDMATRLATVTGLSRTYGYPVDSVLPPCAVVGYPTEYEYDATMQRGKDRMSLPVWVVVGRTVDRATKDLLGPFLKGTGASSVKAAIDSGTYTGVDYAHAERVDFDEVLIGGAEYLAAQFTVDIVGGGA